MTAGPYATDKAQQLAHHKHNRLWRSTISQRKRQSKRKAARMKDLMVIKW